MLTAALFLWLTATALHIVLSARQIAWLDPDPRPTMDARLFGAMLGGIGSLSIVLHVLTMTGGMTLSRGLVALIVWHVAMTRVMRRSRSAPARPAPRLEGAEWLALIVFGAILLSWIDDASRSLVVTGTDAAHYHVPVAVNLAMGASLFDLPATQHLYPVAGSVFGAWFIVPLGSPLLVDLSMCLPFLLLATSVNMIFRQTTGLSGLAWSSWAVLALFSTPIFRSSSLVSADLWFAAALVALVAVLVTAWQRGTWAPSDLTLGSLAAGLLVGSKTTGVPALVVLLGIGGGATIVRALVARSPIVVRRIGHWLLIAPLLFLGAGGVWLIRNWVLFGSPMAPTGLTVFGHAIFAGDPFQPTDYLSILGDMQKTPGYDLGGRFDHFARLWLGRWWLATLVPAALVIIDLAAGWRRDADARYGTRALFVTLAIASTVAIGGALIGAPWTSLEWTRGLALRYVLPFAVLLPLVAFVGLFPLRWPWYRHSAAAQVAVVPLMTICGLLLVRSLEPNLQRGAPAPPLEVMWIVISAVGAGAIWATRRLSPRTRAGLGFAAVALAAAAWTPVIAAREAHEQTVATQAEADEFAAWTRDHTSSSPGRGLYFVALAHEQAAGLTCTARRFYSLARYDEPLTLQSATYRNRVHYVRDTASVPGSARLDACDYVITTAALMETDRGTESARALAGYQPVVEIGRSEPFVLLVAAPLP